jgi:hypothetical protein
VASEPVARGRLGSSRGRLRSGTMRVPASALATYARGVGRRAFGVLERLLTARHDRLLPHAATSPLAGACGFCAATSTSCSPRPRPRPRAPVSPAPTLARTARGGPTLRRSGAANRRTRLPLALYAAAALGLTGCAATTSTASATSSQPAQPGSAPVTHASAHDSGSTTWRRTACQSAGHRPTSRSPTRGCPPDPAVIRPRDPVHPRRSLGLQSPIRRP